MNAVPATGGEIWSFTWHRHSYRDIANQHWHFWPPWTQSSNWSNSSSMARTLGVPAPLLMSFIFILTPHLRTQYHNQMHQQHRQVQPKQISRRTKNKRLGDPPEGVAFFLCWDDVAVHMIRLRSLWTALGWVGRPSAAQAMILAQIPRRRHVIWLS